MEERRDSHAAATTFCHPSDCFQVSQPTFAIATTSPAPPTAFSVPTFTTLVTHQRDAQTLHFLILRSFNSRISPRHPPRPFLGQIHTSYSDVVVGTGLALGRDSLVYRIKRIKGKPRNFQVSCPHLHPVTSASRLTNLSFPSTPLITLNIRPPTLLSLLFLLQQCQLVHILPSNCHLGA